MVQLVAYLSKRPWSKKLPFPPVGRSSNWTKTCSHMRVQFVHTQCEIEGIQTAKGRTMCAGKSHHCWGHWVGRDSAGPVRSRWSSYPGTLSWTLHWRCEGLPSSGCAQGSWTCDGSGALGRWGDMSGTLNREYMRSNTCVHTPNFFNQICSTIPHTCTCTVCYCVMHTLYMYIKIGQCPA